jgi:hypothetical protein
MGAIIASGGAVPLSAIEGLTAAQADALAEHGIEDIDALAGTSVDDLVDHLDISLDEAEEILAAAKIVISARDAKRQAGDEGGEGEEMEAGGDVPETEASAGAEEVAATPEQTGTADEEGEAATEEAAPDAAPVTAEASDGEQEMAEGDDEEGRTVEQHAFSAELDPDARPVDIDPPDEMIAEGYDEAVRDGRPFTAEPNILAENSADPVALTEADEMSEDELRLQGAERDLRPDTITPAPDITSSGAAYIEAAGRIGEGEPPVEEDAGSFSPQADFASEASAPEIQTSSAPAPEYREDVAARGESDDEEENTMNSSEDNAAQ